MKFCSINIRLWFFLLIVEYLITELISADYSSDNKIADVFSKILSRKRRTVTVTKNRIWPDGIIPYEIDDKYSGVQKTIFKQAMRHWENYTCIKFVKRDIEKDFNYVMFTEKSCGCCSHTGKRSKGSQFVSINDECSEFGIVVHELGHAIGFYHEHTRPDRDTYVKIFTENIEPDFLHNFGVLNQKKIAPLTQPYDFDSIMHYASNTYSKDDKLDTILPRQELGINPAELGQRIALSKGDIIQANTLYNCPKCGGTFQANNGSFESPIYENLNQVVLPEYCEWRISVAHGETIILSINSLNIYKNNQCKNDYLEVIDGYSVQSSVLGRFCDNIKSIKPITSTKNRMLIRYKRTSKENKYNGFTANYTTVCGGEISIQNNAVGYLESPNYPQNYPEKKKCIWRLSVSEGHNIIIKFESFKLAYDNKEKENDYLEIRDGDKEDSPILKQLVGSSFPSDIQSSKNSLIVKFISTFNSKKSENIGFSAVIKTIN
ncbi:bone morphogenetic protein 1-like [Chelonus insularis]|uniref:bone morphogenetic protein 1-like n=1 Tax=Chelonus insularis TaxID=460826 RepID=UPI0015886AF5|nr:bone morphogenetic protein 1-like [Chelonus insularis]